MTMREKLELIAELEQRQWRRDRRFRMFSDMCYETYLWRYNSECCGDQREHWDNYFMIPTTDRAFRYKLSWNNEKKRYERG